MLVLTGITQHLVHSALQYIGFWDLHVTVL